MMCSKLVVMLLALAGLTGCVAGTINWSSWENQTVYRLSTNVLTPYAPNAAQGAGRLVRSESQGLEVWGFEVRIPVRAAIGIPYGRMPQDLLVVGDEQMCEAHRSRVTATGNPTEPCQLTRWRFVPDGEK